MLKLLDRVRAKRGPQKGFEGWVSDLHNWKDGSQSMDVMADNNMRSHFLESSLNKIAMPVNLVNYPAARDRLREIETRIAQENQDGP